MTESARDWVIISGANGSLGRAIVERFAARQRPVLALDRKVELIEGPEKAANVVTSAVDLASEVEVKAALGNAIPRTDRIGLLVNAVGLIWNEPVVKLRGASLQAHDADSWRRVIEANLTAPFIVASLVAARMARKGGGSIVNFSSIAGRGNVGQAAYSAAKAGIDGLTRAMASELGQMSIRVNALAPGFIDVPSTHHALSPQQLANITKQTPVRRLGRCDEIMDALDFLSENAFVTGVVLDVNGGLRI